MEIVGWKVLASVLWENLGDLIPEQNYSHVGRLGSSQTVFKYFCKASLISTGMQREAACTPVLS